MSKTYMINARIIDGTGTQAVENGLLVMNHTSGCGRGKLDYVGEMSEKIVTKAAIQDKVVDLQGYTILPGLFNVHVHLDLKLPYLPYKVDNLGPAYRTLIAYRRAAEALNCGVTTVRNVGGADDYDLALKKAIDNGMLWGPRIIACGSIIMAHGGHGHNVWGSVECSGAAEFMKAARGQLAKGVDVIKLCYTGGLAGENERLTDKQMTNEEIAAVVAVAHAAGKKVAVHLSADGPIRDSIHLGIDSVEHAYVLDAATAKLMAEKGAYLVPTLCVTNSEDYLQAHGCPEHQVRKGREAALTHRTGIDYAVKHGVKICCGTDLLPSDPLDGTTATVREIELLTEVGMSPLEAIKAATYNSAELCGVETVTGSLRAGMEGDLIVVKGEPDKHITDLRNLVLVAKGCCLVWSTIPGFEQRAFNVLPPGASMAGGTFVNC